MEVRVSILSVNGSWIGLVKRHENLVGHLKLYLFVGAFVLFCCLFWFWFVSKLLCNRKRRHILQYDNGSHFQEEENQLSRK